MGIFLGVGDLKIILVFLQCGSIFILAEGRYESHLCLLFCINNELIHHSRRLLVHHCCNVPVGQFDNLYMRRFMVIEDEKHSNNFELENKFLPSSSPCAFVLPEFNLSLKHMTQVLFLVSFEDMRMTLNKSVCDVKQISSAFCVFNSPNFKNKNVSNFHTAMTYC